jgi:CRISPR-associated endonuclease Cas2
MEKTLTEKLLYIIATVADHNRRCFSWELALAIDGDPRLTKHRRWLEKCLKDKRKRQKLYNSLNALKRRGFLQEKIFNDSRGYILTPKGKLKILRQKVNNLKKKKLPAGQYLMVFFDIPEKIKRVRNFFRLMLKELGFEQLQKSVWVTSYDVSKELKELIKNCDLEKYAKSLIVKKIK